MNIFPNAIRAERSVHLPAGKVLLGEASHGTHEFYHLFEEPGTLEAGAGLARDWLQRFLAPVSEQRRKFR